MGFHRHIVSSLSLDPSPVLICLARKASTHTAFTDGRHLVINILSAEHTAWFRGVGR